MERKDIYVGMKVKVFDVNGRRLGQPDEGWDGEVVAVRRTKCDIEYGSGDPRQRTFDIDSQHVEDNYRHRYFRTLEEAETVARTSAARAVINDKIVREGMSRIPLEKLEAIAAILQEET
jgi:hypothetical protein